MKTSKIILFGLIGLAALLVLFKKNEVSEYIETVKEDFLNYFESDETLTSVFEQIKTGFESMVTTFNSLYKYWADSLNLDWKLIKAVAMTESSEDPNAIGDNGRSFGLMQVQNLIGNYYAGSKEEELLNPEKNIEAGSKFLAEMIRKYGMTGGIQAYNLGETKFLQGYTSPAYLSKVMANYDLLQGEA